MNWLADQDKANSTNALLIQEHLADQQAKKRQQAVLDQEYGHKPFVNALNGVPEAFAHGIYSAPGQVAGLLDLTPWAGVYQGLTGSDTMQQATDEVVGLNEMGYNPADYGASETLQGLAHFGGEMVGDPLNALPFGKFTIDAIRKYGEMVDNVPGMFNQSGATTWHGGPHKYDQPVNQLGNKQTGAIGVKADSLPMDEASRMQRARDMGFEKVYHGSNNEIKGEFNTADRALDLTIPNNLGDNIGGFFAGNKNHAKEFGSNVGVYGVALKNPKAFKTQDEFRLFIKNHSGQTPDLRDINGYITKEGVFEHKARKVLEDQGFDGVRIERPNFTKTKQSDKPWLIAFHSKQVRDWENARFDPAKKNSPRLLDSRALPIPAGLLGLNYLQDNESY
jgi:hypothetical protein